MNFSRIMKLKKDLNNNFIYNIVNKESNLPISVIALVVLYCRNFGRTEIPENTLTDACIGSDDG